VISWNSNARALLDAAIAGTAEVELVTLLSIGFTVPQYYAQGGIDRTWSSQTWTGLDVEVTPVEDSTDSRNGLRFSFPGITSAELALALAGDVEGCAVQLYGAVCDKNGVLLTAGSVADAKLRWSGALDIPGWQDGAEALVHFTAEHRADMAARPKPLRYTNDAQQRLYSGDTFFDVDMRADGAGRVWPAASFYHQQP